MKTIIGLIISVYVVGLVILSQSLNYDSLAFILGYPMVLFGLGVIAFLLYLFLGSKDERLKKVAQIFIISFLIIASIGLSFCGGLMLFA